MSNFIFDEGFSTEETPTGPIAELDSFPYTTVDKLYGFPTTSQAGANYRYLWYGSRGASFGFRWGGSQPTFFSMLVILLTARSLLTQQRASVRKMSTQVNQLGSQ